MLPSGDEKFNYNAAGKERRTFNGLSPHLSVTHLKDSFYSVGQKWITYYALFLISLY